MTPSRLISVLILTVCVTAPALAQMPKKPMGLEARIEALEKDNAALRADVTRLQKLLTQTRYDMVTTRSVGAYVPPPVLLGSQPKSLGAQQNQTNAAIQAQGTQQQLNNLQLQQNMMQDRQREQQLFQPQTYGPQP